MISIIWSNYGLLPKRNGPIFSGIPNCIFQNSTLHLIYQLHNYGAVSGSEKRKILLLFSSLYFPRSVPVPRAVCLTLVLSLTALLGYALHGGKEQLARVWQWQGPEPCSRLLYIMHLWNNTWKNSGQVNESSKHVQGIGSADTYLVYQPLGTQYHTWLYGSILVTSDKEKEIKITTINSPPRTGRTSDT